MKTFGSPTTRRVPFWSAAVLAAVASMAAGQEPRTGRVGRGESFVTSDGRRVAGRVVGDAAKGFRFAPADGGDPVALAGVAEVLFDGPGPDPAAGAPPFHVLLGQGQRISGRLGAIDAAEVRIDDGPGHKPVALPRGGLLALVQRPGEAQVLRDDFEAIDPKRWASIGGPGLADEPRLSGRHSLAVPAGGSSLTCKLAEPVGSGRFEVAFFDGGSRVDGQRWFVDLTFRAADGDLQSIRAVLGWAEETLAVESPAGPSLAVQPLPRKPGWHRLVARFGPGRTDLAVDGDELAHGNAPGGALVEIRLASQTTGKSEPPETLAAHLDDLRLWRFAEPAGRLEVDPSQDEVRLVGGDQLFGRIESADSDRVAVVVDGRKAQVGWGEVAGLYFRRAPAPSALVEGLLVRLEWRSEPGADARDADRVEGTLMAVSDAAFTLATPYAGTLSIPRDRLRRLQVLGATRRLVLDPFPHHLGHRYEADLSPPQPEGGALELAFELKEVPPGEASLALDVVQVVGESGNPDFSEEVKNGFLRTNVRLNGRPFDYLNRHVMTKNESPERIRLPIPAGLLRVGPNRLRFEQTGTKADPKRLDNLGVLGIALEFASGPAGEGPKP
jgi:hypothetical protein